MPSQASISANYTGQALLVVPALVAVSREALILQGEFQVRHRIDHERGERLGRADARYTERPNSRYRKTGMCREFFRELAKTYNRRRGFASRMADRRHVGYGHRKIL